jgi:hypothetical protein
MCDICRQTPCDKRCPNYWEPPVTYCENCGAELYNEDIYYPELEVCEFCIGDFEVIVDEQNFIMGIEEDEDR